MTSRPMTSLDDTPPADIRGYHRRTRHAPHRYALGPAFLDWDSQPDPFRRFIGADLTLLPVPAPRDAPDWDRLFGAPAAALTLDNLGRFLELALGISAWKSVEGATWAVRNNPSSGNLHPTEAYLALPPLDGLAEQAGLYHYAVKEHGLETRCVYAAAPGLALPDGGFLLGLSSAAWREAWKYGERAFRYVLLDGGHAVGALAYAAAALGWRAQVLPQPSDAELAAWLGLDRPDAGHKYEVERPELLLAVTSGPAKTGYAPSSFPPPGDWRGAANRLSEDHDPWPLVDAAFRWTEKPRLDPAPLSFPPPPPLSPVSPAAASSRPAEGVIRARRSVQRMDGVTAMPRAAFLRALTATLPETGGPWTSFPWPPRLALFLFVHRVEGMEPGRYALIRDPASLTRLQAACDPGYAWAQVEEAGNLPLYLLRSEPADKPASQLSCLQAIAGKGAFALTMLADFARTLDEEGDWAYRRLHWEAGLLGQVLYLEATAAGLAGTGIGCFFDDAVQAALGIAAGDEAWRPVYNFTVGGGLEDARILTLPAYDRAAREGCGAVQTGGG